MLSKKFICAGNGFATYKKFVPSPYFRKSFIIYEAPKKCSVTICGLGFYDIFVNGHKITKGILAPYISNPDHIVYYDEYDITEYINEGKNILGIQLGNGMQNSIGGEVWNFDKADFRGEPRVAFAIEIEGLDGKVDILEADSRVKCCPSPVIFDDLRNGCFYDARREITGWSEPTFVDDHWSDAVFAESPRGEKRLCEAEPVTAMRHLKPISIKKATMVDFRPEKNVTAEVVNYPSMEKTGYLYDFGINTAGIVRLKVKGCEGQKIDLQYVEYIDKNGNPDVSNFQFFPNGYAQRDIYVCKGSGEELFEPQFTYHGFRYVLVLGIDESQATEDLLTYIVCSSALTERGNFKCSDDVINKLQAMTRNATVSNFYYFPTDCPHREKNGWTGDINMSCRQMLLNLSPENSFKEWLRNVCKAQWADGRLPGIVPTGDWGYYGPTGPAWDAALINLAYFTYIYRGDVEILQENADAIFRYANYISKRRNDKGLVDFGLGDWCPVTELKSPVEFTSTVISMDNMKKSAFIFDTLGLNIQRDFCLALYNELRASAREHLVDLNTLTAKGNCQTSQSMAIYYELFDNGEKQTAFKVLEKIIEDNKDYIDFGFIGVLSIFRVLCEFGRGDLAFKMIARTEYPSFGNWVKRGFTALAENFHPDGEFPDSLNHHCFGDISAIFIEYFAGIRVNPHKTNCNEVNIEPCFVPQLSYAKAFYDTPCGRISVNWERNKGEISLLVDKAEELFGEIKLPMGYAFKDTDLSFRELQNGEFIITDKNYKSDDIIEV